MAEFWVHDEVFARLPEACFGVVVARGAHQPEPGSAGAEECARRLAVSVEGARARFGGTDVKAHPDLAPYREAFQALGINPNRFPSSIEAMVSRIAKGGNLPSINPVVDLANAAGLSHSVPLGVHDLEHCLGSIEVRLARPGDIFTPFGTTDAEPVDPDEVVYADGAEVRTRRWIWRQGEYSKSTGGSTNLFFPIDGFLGRNGGQVKAAREQLAASLRELTGADVWEGWVDHTVRRVAID